MKIVLSFNEERVNLFSIFYRITYPWTLLSCFCRSCGHSGRRSSCSHLLTSALYKGWKGLVQYPGHVSHLVAAVLFSSTCIYIFPGDLSALFLHHSRR